MFQKKVNLFLAALCVAGSCIAQVSSDQVQQTDSATVVTQDNSKKEKVPKKMRAMGQPSISAAKAPKVPYRFMVNVHTGAGLFSYFGDVMDRDGTNIHRLGNRFAFHGGVGGNPTNWLDLNLDVIYGTLNGNENEFGLHRNFEARTLGIGVNAVYNFRNIIRDQRYLTPYLTVGVAYADYKPMTDSIGVWRDAKGVDHSYRYHYWEQGGLHAYPETSSQPQDGTPIGIVDRDYQYETPFYADPVRSVVFPIGGGLDLNVSRKIVFRLGVTYFLTLTDKIDGRDDPTVDGKGTDGYLYTNMSVMFKFDPFKKKAKKEVINDQYFFDFTDVETADSDGDGIKDFMDDCSGTPKGITVNSRGCPADTDGDGIFDYMDKQEASPPGAVVDANGVAVSYQKIYEQFGKDTVSIKHSDVTLDWLFASPVKDPKYTVHVGTFTNNDIPTQLKMRLEQLTGLVERRVNDSVSVFTLGTYESFTEAEQTQNILRESGIQGVYGSVEQVVEKTALDMRKTPTAVTVREQKVKDPDVLAYGVELREYRLRIELDKLSKLIAQYGVQMTNTTGGMKVYTIGAFKTYDEAVRLQKEVEGLGVKNPTIAARFNGRQVELDEAKKLEGTLPK